MEAQKEVGGNVDPGMGREVMLCRTCGRTDNVKKCKGYRAVVYCGKDGSARRKIRRRISPSVPVNGDRCKVSNHN